MAPHATNTSASPPKRPGIRRGDSSDSITTQGSIWERQEDEKKDLSPVEVIYIGIAITKDLSEPEKCTIGVTAHDGTYAIDFEEYSYQGSTEIEPERPASDLEEFVVEKVSVYGNEHRYKVIGGAITGEAFALCPRLPSRLWLKLDIVCFVFKPFIGEDGDESTQGPTFKMDEESDSVVRKAIEQFGPNNQPRLMLKHGNKVCVDVEHRARITTLNDYKNTVIPKTWESTMHFAASLKSKGTRIAFFNSTPQGGGVALMRHALIRFLHLLGVKCTWYVPRQSPEVFRITKDNHNILQGVDKTGNVLDNARAQKLDDWCEENATRYWTRKDGPLRPSSEGGAHVVIVDDPQLPMLVEIAKQQDPDRPVIFRSHIQVRGDLCDTEGSPAAGVWNWIWNHVQKCDVFVSHPVPDFVPSNVPSNRVGYLPASTDWLDGLNKKMSIQDRQYYMHEFYMDILRQQHSNPSLKFKLQYPKRPYMVQIARFDPAKGIDDVIKAYVKFRTDYVAPAGWDEKQIPQLIIAGHGAVDDPDATIIYASTMSLIRTTYPAYETDIIVMRIGPTDQVLNALMHNAKVALQLSTREGFEVKVSEALHHGRPVIASNRGGIPLQVIKNFAGFVVDPDEPDYYAHVAKYMFHLFSDEDDRRAMSQYAKAHISDEVSTVGNALSWLYLADKLSSGDAVEPNTRWINDMARDAAGFPVDVTETRLDRTLILKPGSSKNAAAQGAGET